MEQPFDSNLSDLSTLVDEQIPLAHSVLRIALIEYPDLDPARWLGEIDHLADRARQRASDGDEASLIDALDAALCLMQAAWACLRRHEGYGLPNVIDPVEGWIVSVLPQP